MSNFTADDSKNSNKQKGQAKTARIPIKVVVAEKVLKKPQWIRAKLPGKEALSLINKIKKQSLHTVCEEATCPNLSECYAKGTATFMILGDICTRRCPFCDVAHGKPNEVDKQEPLRLAQSIAQMKLRYIVITSVDRDDLKDGGARHFSNCIKEIRRLNPMIKIEILTPDFRGKMELALEKLQLSLPDVFNHNLETVPSLYKKVRPGADYEWSLLLLKRFKSQNPNIATKSGLMLGLGETKEQITQVLHDLREHGVTALTLGQYLQPSKFHLSVERYISPDEFEQLAELAYSMGFEQVASGPMVRSSYHADQQAEGIKVS